MDERLLKWYVNGGDRSRDGLYDRFERERLSNRVQLSSDALAGRKLRRDRRKPAQRDLKNALVCGSELINRTEKLFDVPFNFICLLLHMFSGQVVTQYDFEIVELICDFTRNGFWEVLIISKC